MTGRDASIAQWRREEVESLFTERYSYVVRTIEEAGATWHVSSAGELASSPAPGMATITVRALADRGFSFQISERALTGLRNRSYRIDSLADEGQNGDFLEELTRRIKSPGLSRTQVNGHVYGSPTGKWGKTKRRRGNDPWSPSAY